MAYEKIINNFVFKINKIQQHRIKCAEKEMKKIAEDLHNQGVKGRSLFFRDFEDLMLFRSHYYK